MSSAALPPPKAETHQDPQSHGPWSKGPPFTRLPGSFSHSSKEQNAATAAGSTTSTSTSLQTKFTHTQMPLEVASSASLTGPGWSPALTPNGIDYENKAVFKYDQSVQ
uniref:Uncharacterized protein n=1 Tax=Knipowitschia caucasica TaxID=637954 RepID=A0AAV2MRT1_KNICA